MISLKSYSAELLEHFNHPQNVGHFDENDPLVGTGRAGCIESGDCVRIQVKVSEGFIEDICFKAQGSCATIAVASWVTSKARHQTVSSLLGLTAESIAVDLGISNLKKHSILLVIDAFIRACQQVR